jgi:hypothetical protein
VKAGRKAHSATSVIGTVTKLGRRSGQDHPENGGGMMKPQLASSGSLTGPVNQPSHLSFSILASPTLRQDKKPRLAVQLWENANF